MKGRILGLPLNPLRAFAIAVRHQTFTDAARHMGVSQVAISRQVKILEDYLGVTLFDRAARPVKLTDAGRRFGLEVAAIFDELDRATNRLFVEQIETTVHLRVYPTFARYWLIPRLARFHALFPHYQVRLDTSVEILDFRGTHLDVAIQLGHGEWRDTRTRKLFDETIDVIAGPTLANEIAGVPIEEAIRSSAKLQAKYRRNEWATWLSANDLPEVSGDFLEYDSSLLTYAAASENLGLAIAQLDLLEQEFAQGRLIRPFNREVPTGRAFYVIWPTTKSTETHVRHFIDWLLDEVGQERQYFT